MNDREFLRKMVKPSTWGGGLFSGIIITIYLILILNNFLPVNAIFFSIIVTSQVTLWLQVYRDKSLAREIIRLEEKIEELERRIP